MRSVDKVEFTEFDWDEDKRLWTLKERGIDFREAAEALLHPHLREPSFKNGEFRFLAICMVPSRIIAVVYLPRDGLCRIISARPARRYERETYSQIFG